MKIKTLSIEEVEYVAHELAQKFMSWNEPIPDFSTRFPSILERSLSAPFQTFGRQLYPGLVKKASILFYLLIKNHPFQNGNKRLAVTTLLIFLMKNGWWLELDNQVMYNFAKWVAESDPELKSEVLLAVEKKIKDNLKKSSQN
ncbi:MAG: type II toxin-antitoxin system death-on-curing family toxin [Candidatus Paceibacterota bacterium]|jgi:death-on-curing family protein